LDLEDVVETPDGLKITIRHSKTDQDAAGHVIAIPRWQDRLPVNALNGWIAATGIHWDPILRSLAGTARGANG
jgi:hypothetical protein